MDARFKVLDPKEARIIQHILEARVNKFESNSVINGNYDPMSKMIELVHPAHYREGIMEYSVLVHEMEHALQDIMLSKSYPNEGTMRYLIRFFKDFKSDRFYGEFGAMLAEWQYLRLIPSKTRNEMIENISKDSNLTQETKDLMIRNLKNADKNSSLYILSQWEAGRYSKDEIKGAGLSPKLHVSSVGLAVGGLSVGAYYGITKANYQMEIMCLNSANFQNIEKVWFKTICMQYKSVQKSVKKISKAETTL
jgi:hypothetical protein